MKLLPKSKIELFNFVKMYQTMEKCLSNPNRKKIISILKKSKKKMSISDIHKLMNISYKSVYKNIELLEEYGFVKLIKDHNASGQAVTVKYITETDANKEFLEMMQHNK